ncbi:universal stress protein [Rouxiella badensis]|jgi:nucleotide-binding universal stress UspA family protein|uniref:Universal stress protein UspA n=1 Tax=Rouxiella badensis TaxID=1646377 RepID=A0A1X0WG94_9GAMM|nr:universal stress protein [Rouxiella badensis]MCC3701226.1 universal stress protein [Rouxiella badensis]MCC3717653.1 universal stress protein [Rouxiella badensis]MCC3727403.1 universal stress protein [Rouxiella badensis]MCC3732650.1 universal stress protein [Rouxiella badensis]MCC3738996.1 universal stress protein [Rouxiella badensis]
MFDVILVAVDGSTQTPQVIKLASQIARYGKPDVYVTCCIDESYALANQHEQPGDILEYPAAAAEQDSATAVVENALRQLAEAGITARGNLVVGSAGETLVSEAKSKKASVIVMGHRQLTAFGRILKGSVSAEVVANAHCPVLVEVRGN